MPRVVSRREVIEAVRRGDAEYAGKIIRKEEQPEDPLIPLAAAIHAAAEQMQAANSSAKEVLARTVDEQSKVLAGLAAQIAKLSTVRNENPPYRPIRLQVVKRDGQGRISEVTIKES
jgi:hypothetical protein